MGLRGIGNDADPIQDVLFEENLRNRGEGSSSR
jgi:hypothetical protein